MSDRITLRPDFEQTVLDWFNEDVPETIDSENKILDPDFTLLSDHESLEEQSVGGIEDNQEEYIRNKREISSDEDNEQSSSSSRSKRGTNNRVRTQSENIIIHLT